MNIRPISNALQEVAERELNEIPNQIEDNVNHIKEWLEKQEHIKYRKDDQLIVNFLRSSKYSLERTKQKLDAFYTFRTIAPEFSRNLDPLSPDIQAVLESGLLVPLPTPKENPAHPRVVIIRHGTYDADEITFLSMLRLGTISIITDSSFDDNFIICGAIGVWDLKGLVLKTAAQISPNILKKCIYLLQTSYPTRLKAIHFVNTPKYMEAPLNILKMLGSKKFTSRIHFHSAGNLDEIYKTIPKSIFPKEYGGDAGTLEEMRIEYKKTIESYRNFLLEEDNYFTDESKRPGQQKTIESIFGIEGSFKKLEVD